MHRDLSSVNTVDYMKKAGTMVEGKRINYEEMEAAIMIISAQVCNNHYAKLIDKM